MFASVLGRGGAIDVVEVAVGEMSEGEGAVPALPEHAESTLSHANATVESRRAAIRVVPSTPTAA
jgi:hypothetical protein